MIWNDESKFNIFGLDSSQWYWRQIREPLCHANITLIVKHGGGTIMVWSCISYEGEGNLKLIDGKMTKYMYCGILQ